MLWCVVWYVGSWAVGCGLRAVGRVLEDCRRAKLMLTRMRRRSGKEGKRSKSDVVGRV